MFVKLFSPQLIHRTGWLAIFGATCLLLSVPRYSQADSPKAGKPATPAQLEYNRDVRPILAENCFACHGPDSASRKADLRLDRREDAIAAEAILPGKVAESEMIARIMLPEDDDALMPPLRAHKKLTKEQKETLKTWVAQGAEYQPHWSFIAPKKVALPKVQREQWVRNPIDAFILAELEKNGLAPAPEADRNTLARRLSLDLTGLPPTPAEVQEFVNDLSPNYYEKYVDRLMAKPQWGEHRGRYWLDVARYADTHGIHFDNFRENWAYRDWVIRAFNQNMKFDQFTIEQLAGDLLPNPTMDQMIATGFNRCNITTNEGGIIDEEYLVLYTRDRTETVNQTWMGLTAGCAVCHDHKFDPISAKEFYSMAAFFNNTTQGARDGNIPNSPPVITVPAMEDRQKWEQVEKQIETEKAKVDARKKAARSEFNKWLDAVDVKTFAEQVPTDGLVFVAKLDEGKGEELTVDQSGKSAKIQFAPNAYQWVNRAGKSGLLIRPGDAVEFKDVGDFEKDRGFTVSAWVSIGKRGNNGAILGRMDESNGFRGWDLWIQNDRIGMHIINTWKDDALKVVTKEALKPNQWYHITVAYDGSAKPEGITISFNGDQKPTDSEANSLKSTIRTTVPLKIGQRDKTSRVNGIALQDVRLFNRGLATLEAKQLAGNQRLTQILSKPKKDRNPREVNEVYDWWLLTQDKEYAKLAQAYSLVLEQGVAIKSRGTIAHVAVEKQTMPEAFVLIRGDYDKRGEKVGAATPAALPAFDPALPKNRFGFAKWLLKPEHPLTARVTVNRFWQELFGQGLVRTSGDFGITGELPSHPALLDWLALEFQSHWDIQRFFKLLVMSNTYRQAAITTPLKLEKDLENRLISRGPRYRMDAEMIRDYALSVSGLLVKKIGGASVKPYQPEGVWEAVAMPGSNTRNYVQDKGDNLYRRSMYTFWKRAAPPASMEIFNAPNRETCAVKRELTNTPLQALATLNDVQFVEAARHLATKAILSDKDDTKRMDFIAQRLLARSLRAEEYAIVLESLRELEGKFKTKRVEADKLIHYGDSKPNDQIDVVTLAAWTMLCNQLMNLDEVLNK